MKCTVKYNNKKHGHKTSKSQWGLFGRAEAAVTGRGVLEHLVVESHVLAVVEHEQRLEGGRLAARALGHRSRSRSADVVARSAVPAALSQPLSLACAQALGRMLEAVSMV